MLLVLTCSESNQERHSKIEPFPWPKSHSYMLNCTYCILTSPSFIHDMYGTLRVIPVPSANSSKDSMIFTNLGSRLAATKHEAIPSRKPHVQTMQ